MHYKLRTKSEELMILEYLNERMALSEQDRRHYFYLKKGFDGEVLFDSLTEKIQSECLVLNDLLLNLGKTTFQLDTIIITSNKVYLFEVKNYEGDHFYEEDKMFKLPKTEVTNPLHQVRRAETLLKQLLHRLGYNIPVEGLVVFISPEFTLYQAPRDIPFVFPTQIKQFLKQFDSNTLRLSNNHMRLAEKLLSLHIQENKYSNLPEYHYDQLKKGITCTKCNSFLLTVHGRNIKCNECGYLEPISTAILRSINEFKLLFKDKKVTTNIIYDWCRVIDSKKRVQRVLDMNFQIVSKRKWTYYE